MRFLGGKHQRAMHVDDTNAKARLEETQIPHSSASDRMGLMHAAVSGLKCDHVGRLKQLESDSLSHGSLLKCPWFHRL